MRLGALIALLLISSSISGCINEESNNTLKPQEPDIVDITLPALIEECMMIDDMERCWLIHIPTGYDKEEKHPYAKAWDFVSRGAHTGQV